MAQDNYRGFKMNLDEIRACLDKNHPSKFYLAEFDEVTWKEFWVNGNGQMMGVHETEKGRMETLARKIRPGDFFLCYLKQNRWVGLLRVENWFEKYDKFKHPLIWEENAYSIRFRVKPLIRLDIQKSVKMESLRGMVSFFPQDDTKKTYRGLLRSPLCEIKKKPSNDAETIVDRIVQAKGKTDWLLWAN